MDTNHNDGLNDFSGIEESEGLSGINSLDDLPHIKKDVGELDDRNKLYTKILEDYSGYLNKTLDNNSKNKKNFVKGLLSILIGIGGLFIAVVVYFLKSPNYAINIFPLLTSFISFISEIIIIPTKIVEYLFNPEEMMQINEVIKNIQDYDKAVRDDLYKRKRD